METIESLLAYLDKLQGMSAAAMVFISCIVMGYVWKFIRLKWFPNDAIPVIVILWGCFAMSIIADSRPETVLFRVWFLRNVIVGGTIGLIAWLVHNFLISKLEDYLSSKFGFIDRLLNTKTGAAEPTPKP